MLRIGCGRADITPEPGLPMVGMPGSPRGVGVQWPLRSRVFLVDYGERRIAIVCLELIALVAEHVAELRQRLADLGKLDPDNILVACSHTHRAPFTETGWGAAEVTTRSYLELVFTRTSDAMVEAVAHREPAELSVGRAVAPGWSFNRRPMYAGGQVGTHGPAWGNGFTGMEGTADEELAVLIARGLDGRVLGGLVDFACHPTAMGHEPVYSADYPGVLTEELETRHGGIFVYLIGAAGDTSTPDPTSRDPESGFGQEYTLAMGRALADKTDEAIRAGRLVVDRTGVESTRLRIPQRRPTTEQVELARWYLEERPAALDELDFTRRLYGHDYTFNDGKQLGNERHAQELLNMWQWQRGKSDDELIEEIEIQVIRLGNVAIVAFPVELFSDFGRRVKAGSPFPDTFIATLANGWRGYYAPTLEAFSRGGYEPRFAYPSRLAPEAGNRMTDTALELLRRLVPPGQGSLHRVPAPRDSS
jgi:neutral ceramidase